MSINTLTRTAAILISFILLSADGVGAATVAVYDYSTVPNASAYPGITLGGQDNWIALSAGTVARNDLDAVPGMSGNNAYNAGSDSQSSRLNDGNFSYSLVGDILTLEYTGRINSNAYTALGLGMDANSNSQLGGTDTDELGFLFGIQGNKWYIQQADLGTATYSQTLGLPTNGHTWRLVLQADLAANGGDGSGSLYVQQLGDKNNTALDPATHPLMPVATLQNINLGLSNLAGAASDPANWNGLYTRLGASNMEDLTVVTDQPAPATKTAVYTFDGLTGGGWPGTSLTDPSQDGWVNVGGSGLNVRTDESTVYSIGGEAYRSDSGDGQAARAGTLSDVEDIVELSFMLRARSNSSYMMAMGLQDSATGEITFQFGLQNNNWFIRESDLGAQYNVSAGLTTATEGYLAVLRIDTSANGGNGSGSLLVQNLSSFSAGLGSPLTPVAGLQDIDLKLLDMDLGSSDPSTWDALYIRMAGGGATMDNLMVEYVGTSTEPTPDPPRVDYGLATGSGGSTGTVNTPGAGFTAENGYPQNTLNPSIITTTIGDFTATISGDSDGYEFRGGPDSSGRGPVTGTSVDSNVLADFVATRDGILTLTLSGLEAGTYEFTSWHNEPAALTAGFSGGVVEVSLDGLLQQTITMTNLPDPSSDAALAAGTVNFVFVADGTSDVVITYTSVGGSNDFVIMNGFTVEPVPEPGSIFLALLGIGCLLSFARRKG